MDVDWGYVYLKQHPCESTYEYCERFKYYLDKYPTPCIHFQVHLMNFLDGMLPDERYILDDMAGRWIMDCTPSEVWYLIEERAERTRPCSPDLVQAFFEFDRQLVEINEMLERMDEKMERYAKDMPELISAPAPTQVSLDDKKVTALTEEQADEEIMDEELDLVPTTCTEDVPTKEWTSPQFLDIVIDQNTVIACNPIIPPTSNRFLSSNVQNGAIQKALRNNQVWGSLEKVTIHIIMERTPMLIQKSEQYLASLCINWKTRKKDMRGSSREVAFHTHKACTLRQIRRQEKRSDGRHRTWKKHKKGKFIHLDAEFSMFLIHVQKNRSEFGWKPGWTWRSISHQVAQNGRKPVQKFDGVHPWAPNIC